MGRKGALVFTAAAVACTVWLLFGLGPALTELTAAASDHKCFVGGIAYSWHEPGPGTAFRRGMPVSLAAASAAIVAAFVTGALFMAKRGGVSPMYVLLVAAAAAGGGLAPFAACRWDVRISSGQVPLLLLPLGLTAMVACITVMTVEWFTTTGSRATDRARAG